MKKKISRKREVDKTGLNMNGYEWIWSGYVVR